MLLGIPYPGHCGVIECATRAVTSQSDHGLYSARMGIAQAHATTLGLGAARSWAGLACPSVCLAMAKERKRLR